MMYNGFNISRERGNRGNRAEEKGNAEEKEKEYEKKAHAFLLLSQYLD